MFVIERLKDGLKTLGVTKAQKDHPDQLNKLFCGGGPVLTAASLLKPFRVNYSKRKQQDGFGGGDCGLLARLANRCGSSVCLFIKKIESQSVKAFVTLFGNLKVKNGRRDTQYYTDKNWPTYVYLQLPTEVNITYMYL